MSTIKFKRGSKKVNNELVKLIYTGRAARGLLRLGYEIIDVKPDKNNPERTVFIFRDVPGLKDDLRKLTT